MFTTGCNYLLSLFPSLMSQMFIFVAELLFPTAIFANMSSKYNKGYKANMIIRRGIWLQSFKDPEGFSTQGTKHRHGGMSRLFSAFFLSFPPFILFPPFSCPPSNTHTCIYLRALHLRDGLCLSISLQWPSNMAGVWRVRPAADAAADGLFICRLYWIVIRVEPTIHDRRSDYVWEEMLQHRANFIFFSVSFFFSVSKKKMRSDMTQKTETQSTRDYFLMWFMYNFTLLALLSLLRWLPLKKIRDFLEYYIWKNCLI